MEGRKCPACGSTRLEYSDTDGATVCSDCCAVVEENAIVSSVEFNENNAGGASTVVGQFVGAEMTKAFSSASRGRRRLYAKDSRETTINNGRRCIQQVVSQLHLKAHFVDRAVRLFRTAVERNFVQGRKTMCVVAVCLYMVCREESSPHMLLDFSDAVQINVYKLGHAFLRFKALTGMNVPNIDPCIYIHRFACKLELGNSQEEQKVCALALRLVATMQRDWIQAGRRPSGLCGAALHIATGYHGQARSMKDIARILRVSADTIKKRYDEVQASKFAGAISLDDLASMSQHDFDSHRFHSEEADPPSYIRSVMRNVARGGGGGANRLAITNGGIDLEDEDEDDDESVLSSQTPNKSKRKTKDGDKREQLYRYLMDQIIDDEEERGPGGAGGAQPFQQDAPASGSSSGGGSAAQHAADNAAQAASQEGGGGSSGGDGGDGWMQLDEEDDDTDQYIRTDEESKKLSVVWHEVNKPYLEKQRLKQAEAEEAKRRAESDFNYKPPSSGGSRKRGANGQPKQDGEGGGGGERAAKKRVSKKINYEAVVQLTKEQLPDDIPPEFEGLLGFPIRSVQEEEEEQAAPQGGEGSGEGGADGATATEDGGERAGRSVLLGRARREEEEEEEEEDDEEEEEEEAAAPAVPGGEGEEVIEGEIDDEDYGGAAGDAYHDFDDQGFDDDEEY